MKRVLESEKRDGFMLPPRCSLTLTTASNCTIILLSIHCSRNDIPDGRGDGEKARIGRSNGWDTGILRQGNTINHYMGKQRQDIAPFCVCL